MASYQVKQSSTAYALVFAMIDSTAHIAGVTGLTPTVTLSKNGAAYGAAAGAVTEIANGMYKVAGNATDTGTLGPLLLHATGTGADPTDVLFEVVSYDPQDAAAFGLSRLDAAVSSRSSHTAADVWTSTTRTLSTAGVQAIWDALTSALTTVGSIGKRLADNLDVVLSTRLATSGYTVPPTAAVNATAVRTELTTELGRLDVATSTRLATAGYTAPDNTTITALAGYVDTEVAAIKARTDLIPAAPAAVGSAMTLDLTQALDLTPTVETVGEALLAARVQGFGKWVLDDVTLTLYAADGTTALKVLTLDDAAAPTARS